MSDGAYFGEDFGQQIDLTARIREILRNYPEGSSVLKELIQNADDAGASEVRFCLDLRSHSSDKLAFSNLSGFQGPALLVFNDAEFTPTDFQSIQRIGDSLKKDSSNGSKTGRFGIGFNSGRMCTISSKEDFDLFISAVYHLTDLPTFVSGSQLVLFDPQACHLPNVNPSNPGKIIDFVSHPELVRKYPDQFTPLRCFGCNFSEHFKGTLFRLSLRSIDQSGTSKLSSQPQCTDSVARLLRDFAKEIPSILIFLRHVFKISLYTWSKNSVEPVCYFSSYLENISDELKESRSFIVKKLSTKKVMSFSHSGEVCDYVIEIASHQCAEGVLSHSKWIVCNQMGGGKSSEIANSKENAALRLIPWGGVAAQIPCTDGDMAVNNVEITKGTVYCFLPLPTSTSLPVHINGYFELSSNRRDIWYGEDLSGNGLLRAEWNISLLTDVVSACYARLIILSTQHSSDVVYNLIPRQLPPRPFRAVVESLMKLLKNQPCLFGENGWVEPMNAVVLNNRIKNNDIATILVMEGFPLVTNLPQELEDLLIQTQTLSNFLSPGILRDHYRRDGVCFPSLQEIEKRKLVLDYCISDLERIDELIGCYLIPLANGNVGCLSCSFSEHKEALVRSLCEMGFSRSLSIRGLKIQNWKEEEAVQWLLNQGLNSQSTLPTEDYYICTMLEFELLSPYCSNYLVDILALTSRAYDFFCSKAIDYANVTKIDFPRFSELLDNVFPSEMVGCRQPVEMIPYLNMIWFDLLWKYLCGCDRLDLFEEKWPIVPTSDGNICLLERNSTVISAELLPVKVLEVLHQLNLPILRHNLFAEHQPHANVWRYIQQPTASGIIQAISSAGGKLNFSGLTSQHRDDLREFLLHDLSEFDNPNSIEVIKRLPIFQGLLRPISTDDKLVLWRPNNHLNVSSPCYVNLIDNQCYLVKGINWTYLTNRFIYTEDNRIATLLCNQFNVYYVSKSSFYLDHFLPCFNELSKEIQTKCMLELLEEIMHICHEEKELSCRELLLKKISSSRLIPCLKSGDLRAISELYDPDIEELTILLDETYFPSLEFQEDSVLAILRFLGLQRSIDRPTLLHVATSIEDMIDIYSADNDLVRFRATCFLNYLDRHTDRLFLTSIDPSRRNLKKKKISSSSIAFDFFRKSSHKDLEGDEDLEEKTENQIREQIEIDNFTLVLRRIKWVPVQSHHHKLLPYWLEGSDSVVLASPEYVRPLADQWLCSCKFAILEEDVHSSLLREQLFDWGKNIPVSVLAHQLKVLVSLPNANENQLIVSSVRRIYHLLDNQATTPENQRIMQDILFDEAWVYVGSGHFVSVHQLAFNCTIQCQPFLYGLPTEMTVFVNLFQTTFQIQDKFDLAQYVFVLSQLKEKQNILTSEQITMVIGLAQLISDLIDSCENWEIFLPDVKNKLVLSSSLTFNDAPWMLIKDNQLQFHFLHSKLSSRVAEKLGVPSLRKQLLRLHVEVGENSNDCFRSLQTNENIQSFGQSECLTRRLAHILEQYPEGPSILNELIQNADDAQASKIAILYNTRHYPQTSLLSTKLAQFQGPALYCFNDSEFSEKDFANLASIGQASKINKIATTGRFGLGFNSVYHYTDLPSVISGSSLVMFDPHAKSVPGACLAKPGIKIHFADSNVADSFPDQFEPFKLFNCNVKTHYEGTIFRFPLRTAIQAQNSEIKQHYYNEDQIQHLISSFQCTIRDTLLFLRHICQITFYILTDSEEEPRLLFQAKVPQVQRQECTSHLDQFFKDDQANKSTFYSRLANCPVAKLPCVVQNLDISFIAASGMEEISPYLVCNQLGGGSAREMACHEQNRYLKLIPWGGAAIRLQGSQLGKAFCFLPLPAKVAMPAHINGYFELSSNRRDIWFGDDMTGEGQNRSDWNKWLLKDVIAPAYLALLKQLFFLYGKSNPNLYFSAFPNFPAPIQPWLTVFEELYKLIRPETLFYSSNDEIVSCQSSVLVDPTIDNWQVLSEILQEQCQLHTIVVPNGLSEVLNHYHITCGLMHPQFFCKLIRQHAIVLETLSLEKRQCLMKILTQDIVNLQLRSYEILNHLPIIPLLNGRFGFFEPIEDSTNTYFLCTEEEIELLKEHNSHLLIDRTECEPLLMTDFVLDHFNLQKMDLASFESIMKNILPTEYQFQSNVTCPKLLPRRSSWFRHLWEYIGAINDLVVENNSLFSWPLLPVEGGLVSLTTETCTIFIPVADCNFSKEELNELCNMLKELRCFIVDPIHVENLNHWPPRWLTERDSVFLITGKGLLDFFQRFTSIENLLEKITRAKYLNLLRKFFYQEFFNEREGSLTKASVDFLKQLPIYQSYPSHWQPSSSNFLVPLNSCKMYLTPSASVDAKLLNKSFLFCADSMEYQFYKDILKIEKMTHCFFLAYHVFPNLMYLHSSVRDKVVLETLSCIPFYEKEMPNFKTMIQEHLLIPNQLGTLRHIAELYDPEVEDLKILLTEESFPAFHYTSIDLLAVLRTLGIRMSLSLNSILEAAHAIDKMADGFEKSLHLLNFVNLSLDGLIEGYSGEESVKECVLESLCRLKWLPILPKEGNCSILPWRHSETNLAYMGEVRPRHDMWFCSSTKFLLNGDIKSKVLLEKFGWKKNVPVMLIAAQLISIANSLGSGLLENTVKKQLNENLPLLYDELLHAFNSNDSNDSVMLKGILSGQKWIWSGHHFVAEQNVALNEAQGNELSGCFEPYLIVLDEQVVVPKMLLDVFEVKNFFTREDYLALFHKIFEEQMQLTSSNLELWVKLVEVIMSFDEETSSLNLLAPDEEGTLYFGVELYYDDIKWNESREIRYMKRFVYSEECVPRRMAAYCGVRSLHESLALSTNSESVFCPSASSVTRSCQSCPNLISCLMMMADQFAKCSRVDLIVDYRSHPKQQILQPSLEPLQDASSLIVHLHDVVLDRQELLGCFSPLMLQSAFQLTDVVHVLTGNLLYLFDPTGEYLSSYKPKSNQKNMVGVGRAYDILSKDFARYPDQLEPFCSLPLCNGNIRNGITGTLIRLPWRRRHLGEETFCFGDMNMDDLILELQEPTIMSSHLVFSLFVSRCSLWRIGLGSQYSRECLIEAYLPKETAPITLAKRQKFRNRREWKKSSKSASFQISQFFNKLHEATSRNNCKVDSNEWCAKEECRIFVEKKIKHEEIWMLSHSMGLGQSREYAQTVNLNKKDRRSQHNDLIPYLSVACLLDQCCLKGRIFKDGLASKNTMGLPVHINAMFFYEDGILDSTSEWNRILINDVAVKTYMNLLMNLKQNYPELLYKCCWPCLADSEGNAIVVGKRIQQELYLRLWKEPLFLCHDGYFRQISEGMFLRDEDTIGTRVAAYAQSNFASFNLPTIVQNDCLRLCKGQLKFFSPCVMRLLLRQNKNPIHTIPYKLVLPLLEFCLSDLGGNYDELAGLPLLPLANGEVVPIPIHPEGTVIVGTLNQFRLLPVSASHFVSLYAIRKLPFFFHHHHTKLAIRPFSLIFLQKQLPKMLPMQWRFQSRVKWQDADNISELWLYRFWSEVSFTEENLKSFEEWPLIPLESSDSICCELISCSLAESIVCLAIEETSRNLSCRLMAQWELDLARHNEDMDNLDIAEGNVDLCEEKPHLGMNTNDLKCDESPFIETGIGNSINNIINEIFKKLNGPRIKSGYFLNKEQLIAKDTVLMTLSYLAFHTRGVNAYSDTRFNLHWEELSQKELEILVNVFTEYSKANGGYTRDQVALFQNLPIFRTLSGRNVALSNPPNSCFYYIDGFDFSILRELNDVFGDCFLSTSNGCQEFLTEIGVKGLNEVSFFQKFLLPNIGMIPEQSYCVVLEILLSKWSQLSHDYEVKSKLKKMALFPSSDENDKKSHCASEFFDRNNEVLCSLFAEKYPVLFVSLEYHRHPQWRTILVELGMRTDLDNDLLLQCAELIACTFPREKLSAREEEDVCRLHESFLRQLDKFNDNCFTQLSTLPFVPARRYCGSICLIQYEEGCLYADRALAFTQKPILIESAVPPRVLWSRLKLTSPPSLSTTMTHLQYLVSSNDKLLSEWSYSDSVIQVFQCLFNFLQETWEVIPFDSRMQLQNLAMVPIGNQFIKPNRLFFRMTANLSPFLFEVPRYFGAYDSLFRKLGTKELPAESDYFRFLYELHLEIGPCCLNFNELNAVVEVITLIANSQHIVHESNELPLYLPLSTGCLAHYSECVYNDKPWLANQVQNQLKIVHMKLSNTICELLGIPKLTSVIQEEMVVDEKTVPVPDSKLSSILNSLVFRNGLKQVIAFQQLEKVNPNSLFLLMSKINKKIGQLADFTVMQLESDIKTHFKLTYRQQSPRYLQLENINALHFIDKLEQVFYISSNLIQPSQILAACLNEFLDMALLDCLPIASMLECDSPIAIHTLLQKWRISSDGNTCLFQESFRGIPGEVVHAIDKECIELKPLRRFLVAEVVAFERNEQLVYGIVLEECCNESGLKSVLLSTAFNKTEWFPTTNVFSFKSVRNPDLANEVHVPSVMESSFFAEDVKENFKERNAVKRSSLELINEREVVTAVNDILSRLDISLNTTQEQLIVENMQLRKRLERSELGHRTISAEIENLNLKQKEFAEAMICTICLENSIDRVLVPCGHLFCSNCIQRFHNPKCPICRHNILHCCVFHFPM